MGKVVKIGAKSPSNKVLGVACNEQGELVVERVWNSSKVDVVKDAAIRNTDVVLYDVDLTKYAFGTLCVKNTLKDASGEYVSLDVQLCSADGSWLANQDGDLMKFTINRSVGVIVFTPDDIALLKYMETFKLRIAPKAVAASGTLSIELIKKR